MMIVFYLLSTTALFAQDKDSTSAKTDSSIAKADSTNTKQIQLKGIVLRCLSLCILYTGN